MERTKKFVVLQKKAFQENYLFALIASVSVVKKGKKLVIALVAITSWIEKCLLLKVIILF